MIQQKPIHVAPPQLQCMLLNMQKYDYTIQYKPGKDMVLADHLTCFPSLINSLPIPITQNVQHVQLSNAELDIIQGSVEHDPVDSTIYHLSLRGWPKCRQQVPQIARHFWGAWDKLTILAFSRGQWSAFPKNWSIAPLKICMEHIKGSVGCRHRWGRQCIGPA